MKLLLIAGSLHLNPCGSDVDSLIPQDEEGLRAALVATVKYLCAGRLEKTDWYVIRQAAGAKEMPAEIADQRDQIYAWCDAKESEIATLSYSQLMTYDATE